MAAPVFAPPTIDREGLTPSEYDRINLYWEDELRREKEFKSLILEPVKLALQELPNVLWHEIIAYLSPPALPPVLQAQLLAKRQIETEMQELLLRQERLAPALQGAAKEASDHLAFRLRARQQLQEHVRQLEQTYGPAADVDGGNVNSSSVVPAPDSSSSSSSNAAAASSPADVPVIHMDPLPTANPPYRVLFLQDLPSGATSEFLSQFFAGDGFREIRTVGARNMAFAEYETADQARHAMERLQGAILNPQQPDARVKIVFAKH